MNNIPPDVGSANEVLSLLHNYYNKKNNTNIMINIKKKNIIIMIHARKGSRNGARCEDRARGKDCDRRRSCVKIYIYI